MVSVDFGHSDWFPMLNPPSSFENEVEVSHRLGRRALPRYCYDDRLQYHWRAEKRVPSLRSLGVISKGITPVPSITFYVLSAEERYPSRRDSGPQGTQGPGEAGRVCHIGASLDEV